MDGVPDVVVCDVDRGAAYRRMHAGMTQPIRDTRLLAVLLAMQRGRPTGALCIADRVGYDEASVRKVLGALCAEGYVEECALGVYVRRPEFSPFIRYTIAVEAKLRDWDRALYQAARHRYFANETWAVLPAAYSMPAVKNASQFQQYGVGLAIYEAGKLNTIIKATRQQPASRVANASVAEVIWPKLTDDLAPHDQRKHPVRRATR